MRQIYSLVHYLLMPGALLRLAWRAARNRHYRDRWWERFGYSPAIDDAERSIWVHAVSVGEVQAALPLVQALRERAPQLPIVVTTSTPTGRDRVLRALGTQVTHRYVPYDLPGSVRRFLDRVRPRIAIFMETEIWPNIVHQCRRRSIPVVLANARLSVRSAAGYRRIARIVRKTLGDAAAIAAQSRDDAERFIGLGAHSERVRVTGSVKFDVRLPPSLMEEAQVLRRQWGVDRSVWVAASTHEGEESQVLDAFDRVLRVHPDCLLVIAPRHPERFGVVSSLCRKRGYHTVRRTRSSEPCDRVDVFVGDTMGELALFYAAADVAYVGGSLVGIGGHNMLEPAALGRPIVFGPNIFNFAEIGRRLLAEGAARQVQNSRELADVVVTFLDDANLRHFTGEKGREFVERNRGALDRLLDTVNQFLP